MGVSLDHRWGLWQIAPENFDKAHAAILACPKLEHDDVREGRHVACSTLAELLDANGWTSYIDSGNGFLQLDTPPEKYHASDLLLLAVLAPFASDDSEIVVEIEGDLFRWAVCDGVLYEAPGKIVFPDDNGLPVTVEQALSQF
jgi:hypothetical protein